MKLSDKAVRFFRDNKLDPQGKPTDRAIAIHLAVLEKRHLIVQELIDIYPADCLNAASPKSPKGRTPLQNAAQRGPDRTVANLLAKGAEVDKRTRGGWTALILAAESGQAEIVNMLIKHGADINAQVDNTTATQWYTALHVAARRTSPDTILKLLLHKPDLKLATANGDTALHFAIMARCVAPAALLLFHGASPTAKNSKGVTPLDLLDKLSGEDEKSFAHVFKCSRNGKSYRPLLNDYLRPELPLDVAAAIHWAIDQNLDGAVSYLLHIDPHAVEVKTVRGWHPIHRAAITGSIETLSVLLTHGANVDCLTKTGWTPLMLAAQHGHVETLRLLIDHEANQSIVNSNNDTALQVAKLYGKKLAILLLSFRHVPRTPAAKMPERDNLSGKLAAPKPERLPRTPSPGLPEDREVEGELFALSDAAIDSKSSTPSPENAQYIEKFLSSLEHTWYKQVLWSPEDDMPNTQSQAWTGPVKIAILDTGVDLNHEDFRKPARRRTKIGQTAVTGFPEMPQRERIKAYKSFIGRSSEDIADVSGHGTHIAGLIMAIAPRAELYIARTSTGLQQPPSEDDQPASKRGRRESRRPVEEALRWAIDQNVDIINLSLGFPSESSYNLTRALVDANSKGIIVFAAAANHGNREAIAWPARDRDLSICITCGDKFNKPSEFAPPATRGLPVFITHGEDISSHWPTNLGGGFRKMSGTSVSTPIAVGMAAMILAFLNRTNAWSPKEKSKWLSQYKELQLRSTRGMGRLLKSMCRGDSELRTLSPRLMWEKDLDLEPLQVLSNIAQAFDLPS